MDGAERQSRATVAALLLAVLLPFVWLAAVRVVSVASGENSQDCFYHVTMADLGPAHCMARAFPHMTMSLWTDRFSDKELLFHLILSGLRSWQGLLGLASDAPFHFCTLFFTFGMLAAFVYAAHTLGVRHVYVFSAVLALLCPFFTGRLIMLRPHALALVLMLLSCSQFNRVRTVRDLWRPLAAGVLFAWSYSNPHFVLLPALAFAVVGWREHRRAAMLLPVAAVVGLALGYTLHPQFPNTFVTWKVQCVDVVLQSLSGGLPVRLGNELRPPEWAWLARNALGVLALFVANAVLLRLLWRKRSGERIERATLAVFLMSAVANAGVFLALRAMEYACPLTVLSTGLLLAERRRLGGDESPAASRNRRLRPVVWAALAAAAVLVGWRRCAETPGTRARPLLEFAAWARRAQLPLGLAIANPVWSDFPLLFYSAPQFRYLFGIDPMFGYVREPEKVARIEQFRTGQLRLAPMELAELTNASFAFVSSYAWRLARDMARDGYVIVYQGEDGWLFDLRRSQTAGSASATGDSAAQARP